MIRRPLTSAAASQSDAPVQSGSPSASANLSPSSTLSGSSGSASSSPSGSASSSTASASLDAYIASTPSSPSSTAQPQLCVSVQRLQSSIKRGQAATYDVTVSTENGSASGVTVALTSQPTSQKPVFTSGCSKNDTASCALGSVTDKQAAGLKAQIAVASSASSVSSVKLTATASVTTTAKWTPPAADESTAVTAATAAGKSTVLGGRLAGHRAAARAHPEPELTRPERRGQPAHRGRQRLRAVPGDHTVGHAERDPGGLVAAAPPECPPVSDASPVAFGSPVMTAQVTGLIALGLAILLTVTRLSVRRRPRSGKSGS